ncbi:MAG TPA: hypothetical protein VK946_05795 [Methylotenera sp.]|nr:hypothetical protein [Methylotenera sp.]
MKHRLTMMAHLVALAIISASTGAFATESKANTLLYISPNDYKYSVHLLSPYYDYWFAQGPIVEPIAFDALKAKDSALTVCKANETADTIVRIKPNIFYNPQMHVYHSKLEASVYSGSGNLLGTYVGEAQQLGFVSFDNGTEYHINKVYGLAMKDLMTKLVINPETKQASAEAKLPCGLIGAQVEPKINFY